MSSFSPRLDVGSTIGDYQIIDLLGVGGMGKVFKVRNVISDRVDAMKILLPDDGSNAEALQRFTREIKIVASLDHPNIAALRTAMTVGAQLLMIIEYIEGQSLEQKLRQERIDISRSLKYTCDVLSALDYAHQRGVVHRDIKPSNILIRHDNSVKLTDFGIASRSGDPKLTATGLVPGSLYYMSPEQVRAGPLDHRSDIYSVGVTLYEMVTGRRPIQGDSLMAVLRAHLDHRPTPASEVAPEVGPELSLIIEKALEKSPQARFQTASEFRAALEQQCSGAVQSFSMAATTADFPPRDAGEQLPRPRKDDSSNSSRSGKLDPLQLETATRRLAAYIGPMARILVARTAKSAISLRDLYEKLASEIPSEADRQQFLRSQPP